MRAPTPPSHAASNSSLDISQSYILMVQHLIERCLLLHMDQEECVRALAKYARVKPVITVTVWKELEKENKDFFSAYSKRKASGQVGEFTELEEATTKLFAQTLEFPPLETPLQPLTPCFAAGAELRTGEDECTIQQSAFDSIKSSFFEHQ